jgi:hypothetical protein
VAPNAGQAYSQLTHMEKDIQRQLAAGEGDPEYWEVGATLDPLLARVLDQPQNRFSAFAAHSKPSPGTLGVLSTHPRPHQALAG